MLNIIICGVKEVDEYIDEAEYIISIMNPGYGIFTPSSIKLREEENRHNVLRLEFDDTWQEIYQLGEEMVSTEFIEQALDFAHHIFHVSDDETNLLIHCHEGISRSSGLGIAIYTAITKNPRYAIERIVNQRPQAIPNIEVIRLADEILGLQGELIDAVCEIFYP